MYQNVAAALLFMECQHAKWSEIGAWLTSSGDGDAAILVLMCAGTVWWLGEELVQVKLGT